MLGDVHGLDVVEFGCGTAYFPAWLARRGARPTGVDLTATQLASARRFPERSGILFRSARPPRAMSRCRRQLGPGGVGVRRQPVATLPAGFPRLPGCCGAAIDDLRDEARAAASNQEEK